MPTDPAEQVEIWNLDLAAAGVVLGIVAALALGRRHPRWVPGLAALGGVVVLWGDGRASALAVGAALAGATLAAVEGRRHVMAACGVLGVTLLTLLDGAAGIVLVVGVAGLAVAVAGPRLPGCLPRPVTEVLVAAAAIALWLCVPDTEEVVPVGSAAIGASVVLLGRARQGRAGAAVGMWTAPMLVLLWAGGLGWRSRPAGAAVAVVVAVAVAGWPLAERLVTATGRRLPEQVRLGPALTVGVLAGSVAGVASRTVGLADTTDGQVAPTAALAAVVLVGWLALAWWASTPGGGVDGAQR